MKVYVVDTYNYDHPMIWGAFGTMAEAEAEGRKQQSPTINEYDVTIPWISVADRLPERNGRYLIYHVSDMGTPMIDVAGFTFEWGWAAGFRFNVPTHWMPLPEPPKSKEPLGGG